MLPISTERRKNKQPRVGFAVIGEVMAQPAGKTIHRQPHFVAQLAEGAHHTADGVKTAAVQITKSSALRAFRSTVNSGEGLHLPSPVLNSSGNLCGMVISRRARVIFNFSSNIAQKFQKYDSALGIAGILLEWQKDSIRFHAINQSGASNFEKGRMYALIASTAVLRSVTGVVPSAAHLIAKSLEGYCEIASVASGGRFNSQKWEGRLKAADVRISTAHAEIFSPEFMQGLGDSAFNLVEAHIHFK
jgi:hypothetical protein